MFYCPTSAVSFLTYRHLILDCTTFDDHPIEYNKQNACKQFRIGTLAFFDRRLPSRQRQRREGYQITASPMSFTTFVEFEFNTTL